MANATVYKAAILHLSIVWLLQEYMLVTGFTVIHIYSSNRGMHAHVHIISASSQKILLVAVVKVPVYCTRGGYNWVKHLSVK